MAELPIPATHSPSVAIQPYAPPTGSPHQGWSPSPAPDDGEGEPVQIGPLIQRSLSAIRRYKWLVLAIICIGSGAGIIASRFIRPDYLVQGSILISGAMTPMDANKGPIRADALLTEKGWLELFRSFAITDSVVEKLALYVRPDQEGDSALFRDFRLGQRLRPGAYLLASDGAGHVALTDPKTKHVWERVPVGDSIGRAVGFLWRPDPALLRSRRLVHFSVVTPRDASVELGTRISASLPENTNFLIISLRGKQPARSAQTLNAWMEQFVSTATRFKRRNLTEFANILDEQLATAKQSLDEKELALQRFKVSTITKPRENAPLIVDPAKGGIAVESPVFTSYFQEKSDLENLQHDRTAIAAALEPANRGQIAEALLSIPSVALGAPGEPLRQAITDLDLKEASLRTTRQVYTDEAPKVKDLDRAVQTLRNQTIPQLASSLLSQLGRREADLSARVGTRSRDLEGIPTRTIEEQRLSRDLDVQAKLYEDLKARYQAARLAEAGATPDVAILDQAVAPEIPSSNTTPKILAAAVGGSVALALALALLLDRVDRRFRYKDQVTKDLGLDVVGAVPLLQTGQSSEASTQEAAQVVEAFRTLRLNIRYAIQPGAPIAVTITSPGIAEGKSLISSNLAMSFAEAGYRTLLVDGDVRRGVLHETFGVSQRPGLLDYLAGSATSDDVISPTSYNGLSLLPSGTRRRRGPELVASQAMLELLQELRGRYDAIIVDSAPLAAGIDSYALSTATGNVVLVMRMGTTDRKLAEAKLDLLERYPVNVLGAVLNSVTNEGAFEYYSYLDSYALTAGDEE